MDDKLVRFFNKINYGNIDAFKDSRVVKVTINRQDETWNVYIENNTCIDIHSALELMTISKKGIVGVKEINIVFENKTIKDEDILNCFKYLLNELVKESPALSSIVNNNITIIDNVITIEVISDIEEKLIKKDGKKLINKLNSLGFKDLNINCKINE